MLLPDIAARKSNVCQNIIYLQCYKVFDDGGGFSALIEYVMTSIHLERETFVMRERHCDSPSNRMPHSNRMQHGNANNTNNTLPMPYSIGL